MTTPGKVAARFHKTDFEASEAEGPDLQTESFGGQRNIQTVAYRNGVRVIINYGQHEFFLEVGKPVTWTAFWNQTATFLGAADEDAVVRGDSGEIQLWPIHEVCHYCPEGGPMMQGEPGREERVSELAQFHGKLYYCDRVKSEAEADALTDASDQLVAECAAIWGSVESTAGEEAN